MIDFYRYDTPSDEYIKDQQFYAARKAQALVQSLPRNEKGRDFVVGDIHGCFDLLDQAMKEVSFDPSCDRIFAVGDLINRGPDSIRCLEFLEQPYFHAVRGNHEQYFIDAYETADHRLLRKDITTQNEWMWSLTDRKIHELYLALNKLPALIEVDTPKGKTGIVHADIPEGMNWQALKDAITSGDQDAFKTITSGRQRIQGKIKTIVAGVNRVFLGHTPQTNGPTRLGNCFFIDTGAADRNRGANLTLTFADMNMNIGGYRHKIKNKSAVTTLLPSAAKTTAPLTRKIVAVLATVATFLGGCQFSKKEAKAPHQHIAVPAPIHAVHSPAKSAVSASAVFTLRAQISKDSYFKVKDGTAVAPRVNALKDKYNWK